MTIRVTPRTNAALNMVVNKLKATQPGKRITQDEAIWHLIVNSDKEVAEIIERIAPKPVEGEDELGE